MPRQKSPNKNFGTATTVIIDNSPQKNFLMKFTVSGVSGREVTQALLRLHSTNGSDVGGDFYPVLDTSWDEATLTWNTAPDASGDILASLGQVNKDNWYEVNLLPLISSDGTYSIRVTSTSTNSAGYASSENITTQIRPQLVLTVAE